MLFEEKEYEKKLQGLMGLTDFGVNITVGIKKQLLRVRGTLNFNGLICKMGFLIFTLLNLTGLIKCKI